MCPEQDGNVNARGSKAPLQGKQPLYKAHQAGSGSMPCESRVWFHRARSGGRETRVCLQSTEGAHSPYNLPELLICPQPIPAVTPHCCTTLSVSRNKPANIHLHSALEKKKKSAQKKISKTNGLRTEIPCLDLFPLKLECSNQHWEISCAFIVIKQSALLMHAMLNNAEKAWSVLFLKTCHFLLSSNSNGIGQYFNFLSPIDTFQIGQHIESCKKGNLSWNIWSD